MIRCRFRSVIRKRSFLCDEGICTCCQYKIASKALIFPCDCGFVCNEIAASHIEREGEGPFVIWNMSGCIWRNENSSGDTDRIESAICDRNLIEHRANRRAIRDVSCESDCGPAPRNTRTCNADTQSVFVSDFFRCCLRCIFVQVDTNNVRAFFHKPMRSFFADARSSANDNDDLSSKFFLRWHPLQFCFFKQPIFDVKCFLLWERNVLVNRFGATHHFNCAVIKLRRDS